MVVIAARLPLKRTMEVASIVAVVVSELGGDGCSS